MSSPLQPAASPQLKRTPLHDLHAELGARFVPFAGYEMPVNFPSGILKEHLHTRAAAGLFDVSHMGQLAVYPRAPDMAEAARALEGLLPVDVLGLRKELDEAHLRASVSDRCIVERLDDRALLALQGPLAQPVLARLVPDIASLRFMDVGRLSILGADCLVSRSGYTGEDGYEISVPITHAQSLARALLEDRNVAPIGLGARDTLRLEAGLCLYGCDLDEDTTPVEAGLDWVIAKPRRRGGVREGGFPGADLILSQLAEGSSRRRVGLRSKERTPVRGGSILHAEASGQTAVGRVTSGGFGPTVNAPVAMGYVAQAASRPGTLLFAEVRGRRVPVEVTALPFVKLNYRREQ